MMGRPALFVVLMALFTAPVRLAEAWEPPPSPAPTQRQAQHQAQAQRQTAVGVGYGFGFGQGGSAAQSVVTTVSDGGTTIRVPRQAPPVTAPDLVAAPETCMGATAVGLSLPFQVFGGATFGTTWKSNSCERRMHARTLMALGLPGVALALISQDPDVARAMEATGMRVPGRAPAPGGNPAPPPPSSPGGLPEVFGPPGY